MKKIIVLSDFSTAADSAARYAAGLAQSMSAELEIVHVLDINTSENSLHNWKILENQMLASANEGATRLLSTIPNSARVRYTNLKGSPFEDVVSEYATWSGADLVITGSHGASGLQKILFGSNVARLINRCPKPVIVVPPGCEFNGLRKVAYATDMTHLDEEIKSVARLARSSSAEIVILHITGEGQPKRDRSNLTDILTRMADYKKISFQAVSKEDVLAGIKEAIQSIKPDLLAMFTHERTLTDKIIGRGLTRQFAFQNELPLMVINRTAVKQ